MQNALVVGTATSTIKHASLRGQKLLVVQPYRIDGKTPDATRFCAMAKRFVTDAGFHVVNEALQLHGGYGYLRDYPLERMLRDVRVNQILEGANEIMRVIVARDLLKEYQA